MVKFDRVVHNRRIPHLNDLSEGEILATWIQPEDYLDFRSHCIATVKKMMRGELTQEDIDNELHCPRGLEGKTREGSTTRREHKLDSIAAVMEEQAMQWNEDVFDEDAIMEVYTHYTVPCAEIAHKLALEDAEAAYSYIHSSETTPLNNVASTSNLPVGTLATEVMNRLKAIVFLRASKAALLQDIETIVYNEAAMERRRKVYEKPTDTFLATQLQQYFSTHGFRSSTTKGTEEQDVPSVASSQSSENTEDDDSTSSHNDAAEDESGSHFTSSLQNHFHSRKRRQALLDSIERGFFDENESSIMTFGGSATLSSVDPSYVSSISTSIGSVLNDIFTVKSKRKAVVDELRASSHHRR